MPDLPARTELFQVAAREVIARSEARAGELATTFTGLFVSDAGRCRHVAKDGPPLVANRVSAAHGWTSGVQTGQLTGWDGPRSAGT